MKDGNSPKELEVNLGDAYHARGLAYEKKGEMSKARDDFAEAKNRG